MFARLYLCGSLASIFQTTIYSDSKHPGTKHSKPKILP